MAQEITVDDVLSILIREHQRMWPHPSDRELSREIVAYLLPLLRRNGRGLPGLCEFILKEKKNIRHIIQEYASNETRFVFLTQPEVILILYLLETDRYRFRQLWGAKYPISFVSWIAALWGTPLD